MKALIIVALILSCTLKLGAPTKPEPSELVPDMETALAVGKAVLKPIYGPDFIKRKAFSAERRGGIWVVTGKPRLRPGEVATGGIVEMHISAEDVRVTYIHLQL